MNVRDVNAEPPSRNAFYSATVNDPNAALWASITPSRDPSLQTRVQRRMAAFSPDMLAHRLRLAFPGIFVSHAMAFHAVLVAAMALGASVGLVGFATLDALKSESSALTAERTAATIVEPAGAARVTRETPSLRPAPAADAPSLRSRPAALGSTNAEQPLTANTLPASADDIDAPAPPRAKRQYYAKKKHQRVHHAKKRKHARRQERERGRTPNAKARALARALGS